MRLKNPVAVKQDSRGKFSVVSGFDGTRQHSMGGKQSRSPEIANIQGLQGNARNSMSVTSFGSQQVSTYLSGIFPDNEESLFTYYRDIYSFDPVGGCAVDLISQMPFSDFTLSGCPEKELDVYESTLDRLNMKSMLPEITVDYLVLGAFIGSMVLRGSDKMFTEIIPHPRDTCTLITTPFNGVDPFVEVRPDSALRKFLNSNDPRVAELKTRVNPAFLDAMKAARFNTDPITTLYLPRKTFTASTGTSFFRRILPFYFLEKLLFRGTITEAMKRQRSMLHIQAGDDIWEPTPDDLNALVALFQQAELDPLGAIVATRNSINPSEIRQGGDFWKWTDVMNDTTPAKLRALGISEGFLSGDANFSTAEVSLSVFMENLKSYRSNITHRLFTNKLFPLVAVLNGFYLKDEGKTKEVKAGMNTPYGRLEYTSNNDPQMLESINMSSKSLIQMRMNDTTKLSIPKVNWHKSLEPKADSNYMEVLQNLKEQGIPIPFRMWAASGGITIDSLLTDLKEDKEILEKINKLTEAAKAPNGNDQAGEDFEEASSFIRAKVGGIERQKWRHRDFGNMNELVGRTKTGKAKVIYTQSETQEKMNRVLAKAMTKLSDPNHYADVIKQVAARLGGIPNIIEGGKVRR